MTEAPATSSSRTLSGRAGREWLLERNVDKLLTELIEAMLCEQPRDPLRFLHEWSAHLLTFGEGTPAQRRAEDGLSLRAPDMVAVMDVQPVTPVVSTSDDEAKPIDDSHSVDGPLQSSRNSDCGRVPSSVDVNDDEHKGKSLLPNAAKRDDAGDEETMVEETGDERPSVGELRAQFPAPEAVGIRSVSPTAVGRGNYGYVLRGEVTAQVEDKVKKKGSTDSGVYPRSTRPCALKVVPIRANWTLDEAKFSQLISETANRIATERTPTALSDSLKLASKDDSREAAILGASHILRLQGPIAYDEGTDALWVPLTWAPTTLADVLDYRRKHVPKSSDDEVRGRATPTHFSWQEVRCLLRQLLLALHFLTAECGVVHLDVKPCNILLVEHARGSIEGVQRDNDATPVRNSDESEGAAKLVPVDVVSQLLSSADGVHVMLGDFGLVQRIGTPAAQLGDFLYMAPEIFWVKDMEPDAAPEDATQEKPRNSSGSECSTVGRESDSAVPDDASGDGGSVSPVTLTTKVCTDFFPTHDVWSCGCVLLYLLEGEQPFLWEGRKFFSALEENYFVPMVKNTSRWRATNEGRHALDFLLACFERDYDVRPTAWQLLQHPFLASS